MEAKEKAYQIYEKIWLIENENGHCGMSRFYAKQAAIILADEIIQQFVNKCCEHQNRTYWEDVKQEIEKL